MRVLVTVASKHRSTLEIGQAIGRTLSGRGIATDVLPVEEVVLVVGYDAVIVGSGVYAGQWLAPARDMVNRCATHLRDRPVWLFSSGPLGDPPKPAGDPAGVAPLIELIRPRGHRVFAGRLDRADLGVTEKLLIAVVRAPTGDDRDWTAIAAWAEEIADELGAGHEAAPAPMPEPAAVEVAAS